MYGCAPRTTLESIFHFTINWQQQIGAAGAIVLGEIHATIVAAAAAERTWSRLQWNLRPRAEWISQFLATVSTAWPLCKPNRGTCPARLSSVQLLAGRPASRDTSNFSSDFWRVAVCARLASVVRSAASWPPAAAAADCCRCCLHNTGPGPAANAPRQRVHQEEINRQCRLAEAAGCSTGTSNLANSLCRVYSSSRSAPRSC